MSFVLSKVLWTLLRPGTLVALSLLVGVLFWLFGGGRWKRLGQALVTLPTAFLLSLLVLPLGSFVTAPLETRVPPADLPDEIEGIVILGGAIHAPLTARHGPPAVTEAADRIIAGLALAHRYPTAKVVFSGGSAAPFADSVSESEVAEHIFADLGFSGPRFLFEAESRNTLENVAMAKSLAAPQSGEAWVLVTSAAHMPRAMGLFTAAEWPMLAYPVDYRTGGDIDPVVDMNIVEEFRLFEYGVREWIGLTVSWLRGWTPSFWPDAPSPQASG